jgi:hypothetical protein
MNVLGDKIMKRQMTRMAVAALAAGIMLFPKSFGQEKPKSDRYSAVWAVAGGSVGGATVSIDIRIDKYNTDEDIKKYAALLVESGTDRLRKELEKVDIGQLSPVGRLGVPIAIARKLAAGKKTIIRIVTARDLGFIELRYSGRSIDYPYTILQLEIDANGNGTGTAIAAAKIRFNKKKKTYEIESYEHGTAYNRLLNVQRLND